MGILKSALKRARSAVRVFTRHSVLSHSRRPNIRVVMGDLAIAEMKAIMASVRAEAEQVGLDEDLVEDFAEADAEVESSQRCTVPSSMRRHRRHRRRQKTASELAEEAAQGLIKKVEQRGQLLLFDVTVNAACGRKLIARRKVKSRAKRLFLRLQLRLERMRLYQYGLRIRVRKTERKLTFVRKAAKEIGGNTEVFTPQHQRRLHAAVLADALLYMRECLAVGSTRVAEVMSWIDRIGMDEPFAFETCLAIAPEFPEFFKDEDGVEFGIELLGMDPDAARAILSRLVKKAFGAPLSHRHVLKRAIVEVEMESKLSAIDWVLSDVDAPLSFVDCCRALGFDPLKVRQEIQFPQLTRKALAA